MPPSSTNSTILKRPANRSPGPKRAAVVDHCSVEATRVDSPSSVSQDSQRAASWGTTRWQEGQCSIAILLPPGEGVAAREHRGRCEGGTRPYGVAKKVSVPVQTDNVANRVEEWIRESQIIH